MSGQIKNYFYLMRLDKPIGIFLLLWPTLWALWLASLGAPDVKILIIFIAGTILMRSAGCIINDFADRHFDGKVKRTRERPLAAGKVSVRAALILFLILCLSAFFLVLLLNRLTLYLAVCGVVFTILYPYMKRVTHLPQVGLGIAFSWGIPMAFAAVSNSVPLAAWLVFLTAALWPVMYDTLYAMTDKADDIKIGIKSTAILFGSADKIIIATLQFIFLVLLAVSGYFFSMQFYFMLSLIAAGCFFVYQQYLIKERDPALCFKAFLNNNWVGLIIFLGIVMSYSA